MDDGSEQVRRFHDDSYSLYSRKSDVGFYHLAKYKTGAGQEVVIQETDPALVNLDLRLRTAVLNHKD